MAQSHFPFMGNSGSIPSAAFPTNFSNLFNTLSHVGPHNNDNGSDIREIGDEALSWELTSAKSGHGVQQLRDNNLTTFWQSDGIVPHKVTVLFHKKQMVHNIAIYTDYTLDESYTPQGIVIKASTSSLHNHETQIVSTHELQEPRGWVFMPCAPHQRQNKSDKYLKTDKLIIEIRSSHQSGRDTHIRQIKIYAPHSEEMQKRNNASMFDGYAQSTSDKEEEEEEQHSPLPTHKVVFSSRPFTTKDMMQHQSLR